jgi:hypothetical protein
VEQAKGLDRGARHFAFGLVIVPAAVALAERDAPRNTASIATKGRSVHPPSMRGHAHADQLIAG